MIVGQISRALALMFHEKMAQTTHIRSIFQFSMVSSIIAHLHIQYLCGMKCRPQLVTVTAATDILAILSDYQRLQSHSSYA